MDDKVKSIKGYNKYGWATGFDLYTSKDTLLGLGNTTGSNTTATKKEDIDGYIVGMQYDPNFDMDYFQFLTVKDNTHHAACATNQKYCADAKKELRKVWESAPTLALNTAGQFRFQADKISKSHIIFINILWW